MLKSKLISKQVNWYFSFDLHLLWEILLISLAIFLILNTYALIYYRLTFSDPEHKNMRAFKTTASVVGVYIVIGVVMYFIDGKSYIPYELRTVDLMNLDNSEEPVSYFSVVPESTGKVYHSTHSGFFAAFMSPLVVISSIAFSLYVAAGMAFLPFDLILLYNNQPQKPDPTKHIHTKKVLMARAEELLLQGKEIYDLKNNILVSSSESSEEIKTKNRLLNAGIIDLKEDMLQFNEMLEIYKKEDNIMEVNPLLYVFYLVLGIIGFMISALYVLHNLLGIKGIDIVLESFFDVLKSYSSLISIFVFLILCMYTLITAIYGFYKFSFLSDYLSHGYPVVIDGTWTDTFLININMLLLVTLGNIIYYTQSARVYFVSTDASKFVSNIIGNFKIHNTISSFGLYNTIFILIFLLCLFSYFFIKSPHALLQKVLKQKLITAEEEKKTLLKSVVQQ